MGKHLNDKSGRFNGDAKGVGYKNPPGKKWQPGQSGNPGGVSKGNGGPPLRVVIRRALEAALAQEVSISGGGSATLLDGIVRRLCVEATQNPGLAVKLLKLGDDLSPARAEEDRPEPSLLEQEEAIVVGRLGREARRRAAGQGAAEASAGEEEE